MLLELAILYWPRNTILIKNHTNLHKSDTNRTNRVTTSRERVTITIVIGGASAGQSG